MNTTPYSTPYTFQYSTLNQTQLAVNNSTTNDHSVQGVVNLPLGASLLIINILIIVLNGFMIAVIIRFRTKNAIDIFVLALASTDLFKGLIPVPMSVYIYLTEWYLIPGTFACNFFGWVAFATNSGSMLILTLMSVERFAAIVKPFKYKAWVRPKKIVAVIIVAELFTAVHSTLPLVGIGRILPYNEGAYSHFDYSRNSHGTIAYSIFIICYGLGMILVVMVAYSFVFHKIRDLIHRHRRMSTARSDASIRYDKSIRQLNLKTETMFSYLTVALMVLFWFSWLPFLMVVVASQIGAKQPHPKLDLFAIRIAVVNSMLNPIACAALCKPYRRGIVYYFRVFFSYCGFKEPDNNIWDPWKRQSRRHTKNTRRHKPSVCDFGERDFTRSDQFASSYDDSGLGTGEFTRTRIPSILETYDSYRAKHTASGDHHTSKQHNGEEHQVLGTEKETRLPTLKELHSTPTSSKHGRFKILEMDENQESLSSQSSARSSTSSSASSLESSKAAGKKKDPRKSSRLLRFAGSKKNSEAESKQDDNEDTRDHNKNLVGSTNTPSQRRKMVLIDKVQKYLNHKKNRKNSLDLLGTARTRRSNSAGDILGPVSMQQQDQQAQRKRKIQSFQIKSKSRDEYQEHNYDDFKHSDEETEVGEHDRLLVHEPRKRASTIATMDSSTHNLDYGNISDNQENLEINQDNCKEDKISLYDNDNTNKLLQPHLCDSNQDNDTMETVIPLENGDITFIRTMASSNGDLTNGDTSPHGEERRCISETYSDNVQFPEDNIKANGKLPKKSSVSEHSLKMIDSITKELVQFSQTSLNKASEANQPIT